MQSLTQRIYSKRVYDTYNFLVVNFETTHNKVHRLLSLALSFDVLKVARMVLVRSRLQIERFLVVVNNFQHGHVLRRALSSVELFLEAHIAIVLFQ